MWHEQNVTPSLLFAGTTAATTARTANLDCQGACYAVITATVSAEANTNSTNVTASLLESDDTVATNFATILADFTIDNASATIATWNVNLEGRKRYLRLSLTPDTTTNGAVIVSAVGAITKNDSDAASGKTNFKVV